MIERAKHKGIFVIALLCAGSGIAKIGSAHWEGFEAADPATPAAILRFDSAVTRYSSLDAGPLTWRELFQGDDQLLTTSNHANMGNAGAAGNAPVTPQQ